MAVAAMPMHFSLASTLKGYNTEVWQSNSSGKEDIYSVGGQQGRFSKLQRHNNTSKNNLGTKTRRKRCKIRETVRRREVLKCSGFVNT